jgi:hypothetical protein
VLFQEGYRCRRSLRHEAQGEAIINPNTRVVCIFASIARNDMSQKTAAAATC